MVTLSLPLASTSVVGSFVIVDATTDAMHGGDICSLFALKRPCLSSASPGTYSKPWSRHLQHCDSLCWIVSKSGTMRSSWWAGTLRKAPALPAGIHNSFLRLHIYASTSTSAHLRLQHLSSAHLRLHTLTSVHLHLHTLRRSTSLPPHTHTSASHLHIRTVTPSHPPSLSLFLHIFSLNMLDLISSQPLTQ